MYEHDFNNCECDDCERARINKRIDALSKAIQEQTEKDEARKRLTDLVNLYKEKGYLDKEYISEAKELAKKIWTKEQLAIFNWSEDQ